MIFEVKKILNPKSLIGVRYSKDLWKLCEN